MAMTYQEQLRAWQIEYGKGYEDSPVYIGDISDDPTLCGDCEYRSYYSYELDLDIRYGVIRIHKWFQSHPLLARAVLWHEMCHHLNYQQTAMYGHDGKWKEIRNQQPGLVVVEMFVSFIFPLIRK